MENLNTILYIGAAVLTVVEMIIRWVIPSFRKNPGFAAWVETIDSLWVAMVVALSLKAILLQPFTIPSGSMEDTLLIGDYILVKKYEYGYSLLNKTPRFLQFKKPQRREILVFVYPEDHTKDFIKRCVGLPGDVIEYKDKVLYVNGEKQEEPYVKHIDPAIFNRSDYFSRGLYGTRDNFGPVTVAAGHYFMMGDNRDNSLDSRYWGPVDEQLIKGRAWAIYWHSVGLPCFFSLAGGVVAVVSLIMWVMAGRKGSAGDAAAQEAAKLERRSLLKTIGISAGICVLLLVWVGPATYKEKLLDLKSRIFMVVK